MTLPQSSKKEDELLEKVPVCAPAHACVAANQGGRALHPAEGFDVVASMPQHSRGVFPLLMPGDTSLLLLSPPSSFPPSLSPPPPMA